MRIVKNKLEYVIICKCNTCIAYDIEDLRRHCKCPKCGETHHLHGEHDIYTLDKIHVVYPPKEKLLEEIKNDNIV